MLKVILVASGKGGTGKTSLCAGVGVHLARFGRRVLLIDADCGLRNLDMVLGMSDRVVFSFWDVAQGMVPLRRAAAAHEKERTLSLLTAPNDPLPEGTRAQWLQPIFEQAVEQFDYVLVDCPAGIGSTIDWFAPFSTQGIIVSTPDQPCLRGAERIARELEKRLVLRQRLVINRVRPRMIRSGQASNLDDAMDLTGLPLLGVIPEDDRVIACGNQGITIAECRQNGAALAYANIAQRVEGRKLPLMKLS